MSIKIYYAWRCPLNRMGDTVTHVHNQMFDLACEKLEYLIGMVNNDAIFGEPPAHFKEDGGEKIWLKSKKLDYVLEGVKESAQSGMISFDDIECGFNVWPHKNKAYFSAIGPPTIKDGLSLPDWCEDFAYWNNSDRPKDVSPSQWRTRKKTWTEVCLNDHNIKRLYHTVVDAKTSTDLYEIRHKVALGAVYKFLDRKKKK